ncbi:GNAT family N-acetyltransferase [Aureimonas sp. AU22]|jgi:GNAT superfamily N-acetyltransferase|uniref:GNAT family N-acetyltransferase n=1 Tax=Aureimonas sp. AU22 TaxID=1638162 RepID=UPI000A93F059|nr:GNAT family N-acetyltransferase [Aureimonas sp. AU22]
MSEPFVRPAGPADVEPVAAFLHRFMNARVEPRRWRRILDAPWRPAGLERGWLVEDQGRIVGFMATIYSDRSTRLGLRRFCDLGAWYLERSYRGTGVGDALLRAGMERGDTTYVTLTARRATGRRIRALGFRVLDDRRELFAPRSIRSPGSLRLGEDPAGLGADARRRIADHAGLGVTTAIVEGAGAPVLIFLHRKRKGDDVLHHDLLHVSDPDFLATRAQDLADLLVDEGVLAIDSRFLPSEGGGGSREAIPLARWFRLAEGIEARDVDLLYNETLLLDLKLP